jgi:uncharacterized protein
MRIDNDFTVQAPIEKVWEYLLDVEKVAPCMPGAQLTDIVDERTWKGTTNIKVGPVSLSFAGTVVLEERDDATYRLRLKAQGQEQRGKGAASAVVVSYLEQAGEGTRVAMESDLTISGALAQYGRGMMQDISHRLTREFATCLETNIVAAEASSSTEKATVATGDRAERAAASSRPATAGPVKGLRLGLWAFWRSVVRLFARLFGGRTGRPRP